jgi:polyphosphate glucokinase
MDDAPAPDLRILALDIGGTGLKATVIDADGNLLAERVRVKTPQPCGREALLQAIVSLVGPLEHLGYNRVAAGFPGVVRRGVVLTAPKLDQDDLHGFAIAEAISHRLGHPARVINDADLQGLAVIRREGTEMVVTLGTGLGSSLFFEGQLGPHLELSQHPFRKGETYNDQLGNETLKKIGPEKWNKRVRKALINFRALTNFDRLYIGGGNAKIVDFPLPPDIEIVGNENGLKGGAWLWKFGQPPE